MVLAEKPTARCLLATCMPEQKRKHAIISSRVRNHKHQTLTNFGWDGAGVGLQGTLHIPLPVTSEAMSQVPIDGPFEADIPGRPFLPPQGCQLLVANVVSADT